MRPFLILLVLLLARAAAHGQAPLFAAAAYCGAGTPRFVTVAQSVLDAAGNTDVVGYFEGTVTFGSVTLVSAGDFDIFVAQLDPAGTCRWAVRRGAGGDDRANGVALDAAGNVYVTGLFEQTVAFGNQSFVAVGRADVFVEKMNAAGVSQWASQTSGANGESGFAVAVDAAGNVLVAGVFTSPTLSFANGQMVQMPPSWAVAGVAETFVAKLDASGVCQWVRCSEGYILAYVNGLAVDGSGAAYITGGYSNFPPPGIPPAGFGTLPLPPSVVGNTDVFVAKVDAGGTWQWVAVAGGESPDWGQRIAVDVQGRAYVVGSFASGQFAFSPALTLLYPNVGTTNVFVARLTAGGVWDWAAQAGSPASDYGQEIVLGPRGTVFVAGSFRSLASFGNTALLSAGRQDVFVAALNQNNGAFLWATRAGDTDDDQGTGLAVSVAGAAFVTGTTRSFTAAFPPLVLPPNAGAVESGFWAKLAVGPLSAAPAQPVVVGGALWPNPVAGGGTLRVAGAGPGAPLAVLDVLGRTLWRGRAAPDGTAVLAVPADWPSGTYLVRSEHWTRRFTIQ